MDRFQLHKGHKTNVMRQVTVDNLTLTIFWSHFIKIGTNIGPVKQRSHLWILKTEFLGLESSEQSKID